MHGLMWFLQKTARRAMRCSMRDTSYRLRRHRAAEKGASTAEDRLRCRATRFPTIRRRNISRRDAGISGKKEDMPC